MDIENNNEQHQHNLMAKTRSYTLPNVQQASIVSLIDQRQKDIKKKIYLQLQISQDRINKQSLNFQNCNQKYINSSPHRKMTDISRRSKQIGILKYIDKQEFKSNSINIKQLRIISDKGHQNTIKDKRIVNNCNIKLLYPRKKFKINRNQDINTSYLRNKNTSVIQQSSKNLREYCNQPSINNKIHKRRPTDLSQILEFRRVYLTHDKDSIISNSEEHRKISRKSKMYRQNLNTEPNINIRQTIQNSNELMKNFNINNRIDPWNTTISPKNIQIHSITKYKSNL